MNYTRYTYEEMIDDLKVINSKCIDLDITSIIAINRGGNVLGTYLSYWLDIPLRICNKDDGLFLQRTIRPDQKYLIIDEICDSGETLSTLTKHLPSDNVLTCTIHIRYNSKFRPDIFLHNIINDNWILYPWDKVNEKI
jgi:hypoxanthine phosphoribosyltransferase